MTNNDFNKKLDEIRNKILYLTNEPKDVIAYNGLDSTFETDAIMQSIQTYTSKQVAEAENNGRTQALLEMKMWINLHTITDIDVVKDYVDHVVESIRQFPDQPHPSIATLNKQDRRNDG